MLARVSGGAIFRRGNPRNSPPPFFTLLQCGSWACAGLGIFQFFYRSEKNWNMPVWGQFPSLRLGFYWLQACLPTYGGLGVRVGGSKLSKPRNSPQAAPWLGFAWVGVFVKTDRFPLVCVRFRKHIWLGGLDGGPALKAQPRPRPPPWGGFFSRIAAKPRPVLPLARFKSSAPARTIPKRQPPPWRVRAGLVFPSEAAPSPWPRASAFCGVSESFPEESFPLRLAELR